MSNFKPSIKISNKPKTTIGDIIFSPKIDLTHPLYTYRNNGNDKNKSKISKSSNTFRVKPPQSSKKSKEDISIQLNTENNQINTSTIKLAISYDSQFYYAKDKTTNEMYQIHKSDIKKICKSNNCMLTDKILLEYIKKL
jgi:hypothetical protein